MEQGINIPSELSAPHCCEDLRSGNEGRRQVLPGGLDFQNQLVNQAQPALKGSYFIPSPVSKIPRRQRFKDSTILTWFQENQHKSLLFLKTVPAKHL